MLCESIQLAEYKCLASADHYTLHHRIRLVKFRSASERANIYIYKRTNMHISVFDMYRIGIGPSSSHTVGPMRAGRSFIRMLRENKLFASVEHVKIRLMGSLAATGIGHATDQAVLLGLMGKSPSTVDTDMIPTWMDNIKNTHRLILDDTRPIQFDISTDMSFEPNELDPYHTNTMVISAYSGDGKSSFLKSIILSAADSLKPKKKPSLKRIRARSSLPPEI